MLKSNFIIRNKKSLCQLYINYKLLSPTKQDLRNAKLDPNLSFLLNYKLYYMYQANAKSTVEI